MKRIFCFLIVCILLTQVLAGCGKTPEATQQVSKLYLYGDMSEMTDKKDVRSVAALFVQGDEQVSAHATVKIQGTSSLDYEKKNYTIKFYDDPSYESESAIDVGWGEANEYCLKANWIDRTHSRNVVTAKLAAEVQSKYGLLEQAPCNGLIDGFPVEVYINNEFHGLYTWNIPKSAWLFGMDEENPDHIVMCGENWEPAGTFFAMPNLDSWSVEAGPENEQTLEKFSRLADFIINSSDEAFKEHFEEYLNLDAFLNYYVLVDFAYLPDNCGKNMLVATYDGKVWYPSLYDLDTSWGSYWTGKELYNYEKELVNFGGSNYLAHRFEVLFRQELHDRYFELRKDILTKEHVMELFRAFDGSISAEAKLKEMTRWDGQMPGYSITQIEDYLDSVIHRLDEKYQGFAN